MCAAATDGWIGWGVLLDSTSLSLLPPQPANNYDKYYYTTLSWDDFVDDDDDAVAAAAAVSTPLKSPTFAK